MKDIILFTNKQIIKSDILPILNEKITNLKENGNDLIIDSKKRLYLNFSSQRINDPKDESSEEFQSKIPINNAYLTFIETYDLVIAKTVIKELLSIYNEIYIYIDDFDWYGSASQFLEEQFNI